jgi:hypothetical protein
LQSSVVTLFPSLDLKYYTTVTEYEDLWLIFPLLNRSPTVQQTRTVTKWSMNKGKRKSVKAVTQRFYRLEWYYWLNKFVEYVF